MTQLDFISLGQITKSEQFNLFSDDLKAAIKPKAHISYGKTEKFFSTLSSEEIKNYKNYWQSFAPNNDSERFQKWLFAILSVHSTYESNVRGYKALKDWTTWFNKWDVLTQKLVDAKIGLHNNRTRYIKDFALDYWRNPSNFQKSKNETWKECRDRLVKRITGLGFAKVSFAFEMIAPLEVELACIDTHIYQAYGLDQTRNSSLGKDLETHWVQMSKLWNCPPAISRAIYWDRIQGEASSAYWMSVFSNEVGI